MDRLKAHLFVIGCIFVTLCSHASAAALPFGQTQTGTISSAGQSNSYTFNASADDVVNLTMATTSGNLRPVIALYSPAGALVNIAYNGGCGGGPVEMNTVTLPATGTYTVLVRDCGDTNTGNYVLFAQRTNNPAGAAALPFGGQPQTGTISSAAQSNSYTFMVSANDVVSLTMATTSGNLRPVIALYSPAGALVHIAYNGGCGGGPVEMNSVSLKTTGTYAVLVRDCGDTNTGNYNLSAQCVGVCPSTASPVITISSLPNGIVNQPYGPVTMAATGGSGNYSWSVTGAPAGVTLSSAGILSGTPTAMGTFSLSISVTSGGTTVSATLPLIVSPPPPPKPIVLLTRNSDDATVDYFSSLLTAAGLPFTTLTAAQVTASKVANVILIAGFSAQPTEFMAVASVISNAVKNASWLICEAYGAYLPSFAGVGSVSTSSTDPVVLDHHAFVKPVDSSGALLFNGIATWDPPNLPDEPAQYTEYYLQTSVYGVVSYNPPPDTNIFSYWNLTLTYGWNFQATNSAYCQSWGGCTGERSVYQASLYLVPVGNGEIFVGPDGIGVIAGYTQYGPALDAIHKNAIQLAGPLVTTSGSPLAITTSFLPSEAVNQPYGPVTMTAAGGSGSYSWSVTGAPAGLSMSATGILSGTPTTAGTFSLSVSVAGGGVTASATFPVTIAAHALPLQVPGGGGTTPVTVPGGAVSIPYSQSLPANYGSPPYSWSLLGGALPTGLSLASSGTVSGIPTQAGTFAFTAKVTDSSGASASSAFAITIAPQGLTITTTSPLPNGIAASDYPAQIMTASGGYAPYTFQVTTGALPGGLVFSGGQISGTPTTSGVFTFTVTVTDSSQSTATASFQITILPAQANLILSQASLSFPLSVGASGLPVGASVSVRSSVVAQLLNYTVSMTPAAPWLDVTGGGTTPGAIGVNLDPKALSLGAGVSQASIVVACIAPSPCAGSSQTINVTLNVTAAAPQLGVTTSLLSFSAQTSNPQPVSQTLGIGNLGGGTIMVNSVTAKDSFVTISGVPATIAAGPPIPVTVTVNPAGLAAGYYQSTIFVNTSAGSTNVAVTLFVAPNATMTLSPAGTQFQMVAGSSPGNSNGSFLVGVSGNSAVNWNATLLSAPTWLTLNTSSGTSTSANPGAVSFAINPAVAATLAPQAYYGTIQVTSSSVVDSPQSFLVVLNVAPAANPAIPDPEPAGLLFIASASGALPKQSVQVFASSQNPVNYQASSGSSWLMVGPSTGSTSAASPGSSSVSVNLSGLAPGVYTGGVSYALSSASVRTVNVTLIVEASAATGSDRTPATALAKATCSPTQLVPTQTGLVNNFAQPTSWPTPLAVLLDNDCGQPVTNGQVVAAFSNGDPPLALTVDAATGIYAGTWTPRNAAGQVTVSATATASGFPAATVRITGQVTPNATPIVNQNGTLNVFAPVVGAPVAPGTIVQIYGSNFAAQATQASTIPLPTSLGQTSVLMGGLLAPLYYVSPGQINAQVPFELAAGRPYDVIVSANGAPSTPNPIQLTSDAPGIAQFPAGEIIAQHLDSSLVLETSPAAPGEIIVFYVAGMGLTNQTVPSGTASPSTPNLAVPLDAQTLTLNGAPVTNILFAGMTPTLVGLYQVDFQVPATAPNGDLQLVLTQTSGESNAAILPVHN